MKSVFMNCFFLVCLISAFSFINAQEKPYPLRDAVECSPRGGLPNFFAKLKAGKDVKIAYLGGSITCQNGWRVLSKQWFQKNFPKAKVSEIHAAIGGTGSNLGVFRLEHDALQFKPDLLFVEFAVNDSKAALERIIKAMEGIVRQTWKTLPECDICFVYTITARDIKNLNEGKMKRSASVMEKVADHYNIPSIHLGIEVAKLAKEGKLTMKAQKAKMSRVSGDELNQASGMARDKDGKIAFSRDGVHPYTDTGHVLYMEAIARSIPAIEKTGKAGQHKLGKPLSPNNWEKAGIYPLDKAELTGFTKLPADSSFVKRFGRRLPGVWKGGPGATVKFKFKGVKVSVYDLVGPDCGYLEVTLDGKKRELRRMDGYCHYHRLATLVVGDKLADKVHEVEIKVLGKELDKSKILFKSNLHYLEENPEKFKGTNWYVGGIMIIGELAK